MAWPGGATAGRYGWQTDGTGAQEGYRENIHVKAKHTKTNTCIDLSLKGWFTFSTNIVIIAYCCNHMAKSLLPTV